MSTFRTWLASSAEGLLARGGLWAVCLSIIWGTFLLLATTVFLVAILIALILLAPVLVCHLVLDWMHVKLFTLSKTRSSNAKM
jgi:hypothetical protein